MLAGLDSSGWIGLRDRLIIKLTGQQAPSDRIVGYAVYRAWFPYEVAASVVRRCRPDVAVLNTWHAIPLARALQAAGVPVVIYLRDVEFKDLDGDLAEVDGLHFVANSNFTARRYHEQFGIEAVVVPPLFQPDRYLVKSTRKCVTFVNPHLKKGVDIALALAFACPDIPFKFVEGWILGEKDRANLLDRIAAAKNIIWVPRTQDMRTVYADTKIVLAPSRWEEAWCRVVSEAHYSGIPALASSQGGLPESVGPGGTLVDVDAPIERWVSALRRMWDDADHYQALSRASLDYSGRPLLDREVQVSTVLGVLRRAVEGPRSAKLPAGDLTAVH